MLLKKINRDALESLVVRVPVILFSFLHSIFLIRLLGPEGNGLYTYLMAGISFSMVAAGFDVKRSTLYHLTKSAFDSPKVLGIAIKIHLLSVGIVALFITTVYFLHNDASYLFIPEGYFSVFYTVFFLMSFAFQHLTMLCQTILQAQKEFRSINLFLLISNIIQVILYGGAFLFYLRTEQKIELSKGFLLILCAQGLSFLLVLYYTTSKYEAGVDFKTKAIRQPFIQYVKLGYANQVGHFLNKRLDVWFVEIYAGLSSLGIYALASQLTNFLLLAAAPIEEVLKPYLMNLDRAEGNIIFIRYFKLILYFIILISAILFTLGPWLISILFGEEFAGASTALRILCIGVVFVNVKRVFLNYNRAYNDLKFNIWAQWSGVVCTIIMGLALIPNYGIEGAAWASVMAYAISGVILAVIFMRKQSLGLRHLLILKKEDLLSLKP